VLVKVREQFNFPPHERFPFPRRHSVLSTISRIWCVVKFSSIFIHDNSYPSCIALLELSRIRGGICQRECLQSFIRLHKYRYCRADKSKGQ
jgi:hypothetical protein